MVVLLMQSVFGSKGSVTEEVELNPAFQKEEEPILGKKSTRAAERAVKGHRCCLCGRRMSSGGFVVEERPTAEDGSTEKWFYCPACWIGLRKLREPSRS